MEKDVRSNIPADAIQEFRVLTNQYAAEYGNASGLQVSSITRSGSNEFRGRVSLFYRSDVFDSKNYFARDEDKTELDDLHFGFFLGGPIKKDKTHFFIAYEGRYKNTYQLVTSPLVLQESVPTKTTNNQFFLKINHILSGSNFLTFRFTYDEPLTTNYNVGGLHTREQAADEGMRSYDFQGNWTFATSNNTLNEFRLLYGNFQEEKTVENPDDYYIIRPSGYLGGFYTAPYLYSEKRLQIVENFSLFLKNHTIKMGFNLNFISTDGEYSIYYPGAYEFNTDLPFNPMDPLTYPFLFVGAQNEQFLDSFKVRNHGIFVQDSWHVFQNLTLNLGLRYNYYDPEGLDINNNSWKSLNPRFGFSWDITGQGSLVIRGGVGTFSNSIFTFYAARVAQSQAANLRIILMPGYPDPNLPNPFSPYLPIPTTELPPQEYVAQEGQIPPYTMQVSLGAEGRISRDVVLSADLVWSKGYYLLRDNNLNPGIPGGYGLLRPDMTKGDVFVYEDSGKSEYKGLQIGLRKRYSSGWSGEIAYTLSKSMTNVASDWLGNEEQMSWNNPRKDWGPHRYDARHRFNLIGMFDLPLAFRFSAVVRYHSAYPYNVVLGYDANKDGQNLDYPEGVNRFSERGNDFLIIDTRLTKDIQIKKFNFQLFIDIFNLTNRTNFVAYTYIGNMQSENFGEPTEAWNPRLIQLGLRVDF
jgi:outer membrane receptor protein involved in Fe transport